MESIIATRNMPITIQQNFLLKWNQVLILGKKHGQTKEEIKKKKKTPRREQKQTQGEKTQREAIVIFLIVLNFES